MTGQEHSILERVEQKLDDLRDEVTALKTRINHPSPRDCSQAEQIADLFRRVGALEQWRAWVIGVGAAAGIAFGLLAQRLMTALGIGTAQKQ